VLVDDAADNGGIAGIEVVCGSGIGGCGGGGEERGLMAYGKPWILVRL
jgi:hypothetical protein